MNAWQGCTGRNKASQDGGACGVVQRSGCRRTAVGQRGDRQAAGLGWASWLACWAAALVALGGCSGAYDRMDFGSSEQGPPESTPAASAAAAEKVSPVEERRQTAAARSPSAEPPSVAATPAGEERLPKRPGQARQKRRPSRIFGAETGGGFGQPQGLSGGPGGGAVRVRLWRGVALPQTGPTGTMMGFHLEYEVQGQLASGEQFVLVIERAQGEPFRQPVRLARQGQLEGFVLGWRPEEGPFQAHIEDGQGNRLSASLPLR